MTLIKLFLKKYWFFVGLISVFCITIGDVSGTTAQCGKWVKIHRGLDFVIMLIIFTSGLLIKFDKIKDGIMDIKGTVATLATIFIAAPVISLLFLLIPLKPGIMVGIFIVSAMPTTLSTGVVMTGASGGNMAHALMITILSNFIAVVSIPITLSAQMMFLQSNVFVTIDKTAIMIKLIILVLFPLCAGFLTRNFFEKTKGKELAGENISPKYILKQYISQTNIPKNYISKKNIIDKNKDNLQILNQLLVLSVIWMALSHTRDSIINCGENILVILGVVSAFHILLVFFAIITVIFLKLGHGKRESVIFMGGQKTLPLALLIQVAVFPQYGLALVVCIFHHIIHVMMDSLLVGKIVTVHEQEM